MQPRPVRRAMAAIVALMLAHNLVLLAYNQATFDRWHRYAVQRPTLRQVAEQSKNVDVRRRLGFYYQLRDELAPAHLTIPRSLRREAYFLESISRLEVSVADEDPPAPSMGLVLRASQPRWFRSRGQDYQVRLLLSQGATRYVLHPRPGHQLLLAPE